MPKHRDLYDPSVSIGEEGRRVRERFRKLKQIEKRIERRERLGNAGGPDPTFGAMISPEHYHIVYQYEDTAVPHFRVRYDRQRDAYLEVARLGEASEPNTEWYDDGRVMIETTLHGRTGLHRVILRVTACIAKQCGRANNPIILPLVPTKAISTPLGRR